MEIRKLTSYTPAELNLVSGWMQAWWGEAGGYSPEQVRAYLLHAACENRIPQTYAAYHGGLLAGIYHIAMEDLFVRPDLYPWLCNVYVSPAHRGCGIGRALLYAYTEQKGLHVRWLCPLLCAVFTAAAVLTWESAFSLLPTAAMLLSTLAYEQKQPRRFRRLMFPCSPLWMVYNIHSGSVSGVVTEAFAMLSLGVAMWRYDRAPKSE